MIARSNKKTWSREEDAKLIELVDEHGANNWTLIAKELGGGKRSKQCRERYHNHLQADIKKGGWTDEEERRIFELQAEYGNQWAKIASHFPGRTDNSIKNRFNSMMRSIQHKQMKALTTPPLASQAPSREESVSSTPSISSTSSTSSSGVLYSISAVVPAKRHPLVPKLAIGGVVNQESQSLPLTITVSSSRSSGSSSSFKLSPYNFSSSRSLLDMAQFKMDGDVLETVRSNSSFEMLRAILEDSEGESSDEEEDFLDVLLHDTIIPFSARDFYLDKCSDDSTAVAFEPIAPFSSRESVARVANEEIILSPWWEERDVVFDLGSVIKKIEISPRQKTITHVTPRSPFLINLKKQRRGV